MRSQRVVTVSKLPVTTRALAQRCAGKTRLGAGLGRRSMSPVMRMRSVIGPHDIARAQEIIAAGQAERRCSKGCRRTMNRGNCNARPHGSRMPIQDRLNSTAGNDRNAFSLRGGAGQGAFSEPSFDDSRKCASRGYGALMTFFWRLRVAMAVRARWARTGILVWLSG